MTYYQGKIDSCCHCFKSNDIIKCNGQIVHYICKEDFYPASGLAQMFELQKEINNLDNTQKTEYNKNICWLYNYKPQWYVLKPSCYF